MKIRGIDIRDEIPLPCCMIAVKFESLFILF